MDPSSSSRIAFRAASTSSTGPPPWASRCLRPPGRLGTARRGDGRYGASRRRGSGVISQPAPSAADPAGAPSRRPEPRTVRRGCRIARRRWQQNSRAHGGGADLSATDWLLSFSPWLGNSIPNTLPETADEGRFRVCQIFGRPSVESSHKLRRERAVSRVPGISRRDLERLAASRRWTKRVSKAGPGLNSANATLRGD